MRKLRLAADRRRHHRASPAQPRVLGPDRDRSRRPERVPNRAGGMPATACGWSARSAMSAAGLEQLAPTRRATGVAGRNLSPPRPAARRRACARAAGPCNDGCVGRIAARCPRMAWQAAARCAIDLDQLPLSERLRCRTRRDSTPACSRRPVATIMPCWRRFRPGIDPATLCLPAGDEDCGIGTLADGPAAVRLTINGEPLELPERLGFEHSRNHDRTGSAAPVADRRLAAWRAAWRPRCSSTKRPVGSGVASSARVSKRPLFFGGRYDRPAIWREQGKIDR